MSTTVITSSAANGNVSAATAAAAARTADTGLKPVTFAKALNTAMADAMALDESVLAWRSAAPPSSPQPRPPATGPGNSPGTWPCRSATSQDSWSRSVPSSSQRYPV